MKKILLLIFIVPFFASCSKANDSVDVKSPCVSLEGGPCGPKQSINDWWIKNQV